MKHLVGLLLTLTLVRAAAAQDPQYMLEPSTFGIILQSECTPRVTYLDTISVTNMRSGKTYARIKADYDLSHDTTWCTFEPSNFMLAEGQSQTVIVKIRLSDTSGKQYRDYFTLWSSPDGVTPDPDLHVILVQAKALNLHPRHLTITPDSVNFDTVALGTTVFRTFTLISPDSATGYLDGEPAGYEYFVVGSPETNPIPSQTTVTVRFHPLGLGERVTYIAVAMNTMPELQSVALRGYAAPASGVTSEITDDGKPRVWLDGNNLHILLRGTDSPADVSVSDVLGRVIDHESFGASETVLPVRSYSGLVCCTVTCKSKRWTFRELAQ